MFIIEKTAFLSIAAEKTIGLIPTNDKIQLHTNVMRSLILVQVNIFWILHEILNL